MIQKRKILINLTYPKGKRFSVKDPFARMKTQGIDWEKIFAKHIPEQSLISRIC